MALPTTVFFHAAPMEKNVQFRPAMVHQNNNTNCAIRHCTYTRYLSVSCATALSIRKIAPCIICARTRVCFSPTRLSGLKLVAQVCCGGGIRLCAGCKLAKIHASVCSLADVEIHLLKSHSESLIQHSLR